ncbi:hypothetical protein Sango_2721300 [Sesamum angolense]|uniref:RNase H type-1 domain-containing protein n=1 Tax=Sesamum angolense TaxID=2727404 RepID=A0AAE1W3B6_9LAMI|nr:hypothetical protein Sango_2721300 [Sesamum angolense]
MQPPTNLNEVHKLAGRRAALNRFISRSTKCSLSFFKAIRKTKKFILDEERQQAFQDMKTCLVELPLLTKPILGNRAGVVLTSPEEDNLEYALCFDFNASNNEAKYEALITGFRMALDTGAKSLIAYSDSQLVTHQLEEEGRNVLQELPEGVCGSHIGGMALADKTLVVRFG